MWVGMDPEGSERGGVMLRAAPAGIAPPEPSRKAAPGQGILGGLTLAHLLAQWLSSQGFY